MKESYVYIGLKEGPRNGFYVKVGKSNNPEKRMVAYWTHCPGGLLSMYAAPCASEAAAFASENRLFSAINGIRGAWHEAGEWLYVPSESLDAVFDVFSELIGRPERVTAHGAQRFRQGKY